MKDLPEEVYEYLKTQRVGNLAVEMLDGSPHGATVHFAHTEKPPVFYYETDRTYRKAEPILNQKTTRATFVVGASEEEMKTLQLDGEISVLSSEDIKTFDEVYFRKFPDKLEKSNGRNILYFKFIPNWWRFTDWTGPDGKVIVSSED